METALAIYEALIQSNVPAPAARRVAEALEKDMSTSLATKEDLRLVRQDLTAFENRFSLMLQNTEQRAVIKLGGLMTALFGVAAALVALLR